MSASGSSTNFNHFCEPVFSLNWGAATCSREVGMGETNKLWHASKTPVWSIPHPNHQLFQKLPSGKCLWSITAKLRREFHPSGCKPLQHLNTTVGFSYSGHTQHLSTLWLLIMLILYFVIVSFCTVSNVEIAILIPLSLYFNSLHIINNPHQFLIIQNKLLYKSPWIKALLQVVLEWLMSLHGTMYLLLQYSHVIIC